MLFNTALFHLKYVFNFVPGEGVLLGKHTRGGTTGRKRSGKCHRRWGWRWSPGSRGPRGGGRVCAPGSARREERFAQREERRPLAPRALSSAQASSLWVFSFLWDPPIVCHPRPQKQVNNLRTLCSGGSREGERSVRRRRSWSKRRSWRGQSAALTSRSAWLRGEDEIGQMQAWNAFYLRLKERPEPNHALNSL